MLNSTLGELLNQTSSFILGIVLSCGYSLSGYHSSSYNALFNEQALNAKVPKSSKGELTFGIGTLPSDLIQSQRSLAPLGILVYLDGTQSILRVTAIEPSEPKVSQERIDIKLVTHLPVELEGATQHSITLISKGARIKHKWTSPSLTLIPSCSFESRYHSYSIAPEGRLEVQSLNLKAGQFKNEGTIISPAQLELTVQDGILENLGKIESVGFLRINGGQRGQTPEIHNLGEITAPEIYVGNFYSRFYSFKNGKNPGSLINSKKLIGTCQNFINLGEILITEEVSLSGFRFENREGNLYSGGILSADFAQIDNSRGNLSGVIKTELKIRERLTNIGGQIGAISPTEISFDESNPSDHLGNVQGTDVSLRFHNESPTSLKAGAISGQKSVSLISETKVLLPAVQVHTPQFHLAVPDFALDEQKDCSTTVIHCSPTRDFTLTSSYCTQGQVIFLQSCLKPSLSKIISPKGSINSTSSSSTLAQDTSRFLQQRLAQLQDEVSQMSVHFKREGGRFAEYNITLQADLKSAKDVQFVAPLANIYLGDRGTGAALEAQSLGAWVNFLFLINGHVAVNNGAVHAPGGLRIGTLVEDATEQVRVADEKFPLMCRNGALWVTQNQTFVSGPLHCDGTMQVGGDFILASEKEQWCRSPDIRVQGDLVLKGSGTLNVVRNLGETLHQGDTPLPTTEYTEAGTLRVGKRLIAEKPVTLRLYSTSLHADQFAGDLTANPIDSTGKQAIQFPGEKPEKLFRASVSSTQGGIMKLEGKNNAGVLASPQLFLVEEKGQFVLATKNPYYVDARDPLHDLLKRGFQRNTTYVTQDLKAAMQKAAEYRFHFSLRERFFFNHTLSEQFYDQIKNDVVILKPGYGLLPLPPGQAVFSLSPQFLLKQVQDSVQENLMRGYLYENRPISLELLAELHRNATEYLATLGINWSSERPALGADQQLMAPLRGTQTPASLPKKPLIFYQQVVNDQGIAELKPFFFLPPSLLEQARAEQTGNVFATILGRFTEGTTAEEMVEKLAPESGVKKALIEFFEKNPETKEAVTQAALRYRLKDIESDSPEEDSIVLDFAIRAKDFAIVAENDISVDANQKGKSGAIISKKGSISIASKKTRHNRGGNNYEEVISDQRTLHFEGHLELRAGKDIRTQAVDLTAGSLKMDAQGDIIDAALKLESHSESETPGVQERKDRTQQHVSQAKIDGKMGLKAQNIALQGTHAEADSIQLDAKDKVAILGVQESSSFSKVTVEDTGALFWAGKKTETQSESKIQFKAASLKAKGTVGIKTNEAILEAPKIEASETEIHAERLKIKQGKNKSASASSAKSESAWWISADSEEQKHETFTQAEFNGKTKLFVNELELEQVRDEALKYLDQLEFDPAQTKVIYEILNEIHHRETKSISAPGPALIAAVAVISSVATGGVGGAAVAGIGGGLKGTITGTMISAAISSITAQVTTQVALGILSQQSLDEIFRQITRPETFKNAAISAITAGTLDKVGQLQEAAKTSELLCKVQNAGVQAGLGLGVDLLSGEDLGDALKSAGIQFGAQAGSSVVAGKVGEHFAKKTAPTERCLHKLAHGASAAAFAGAGAAALGKDIGTAATGAALGAMTAEIVAETLATPLKQDFVDEAKKQQEALGRPLTEIEKKAIFDGKMHDVIQIAKLTGAISGLVTGDSLGVSAASSSSKTALDNNFLAAAAPLLWEAALAALAETTTTGVFIGSVGAGGYALHKATEPGEEAGDSAGAEVSTSREARKKVMQKEGIPTSQQPISQSQNESGRQYQYEVPKEGGGTKIKSVQQQTKDRSHPGDDHWEAGDVKVDPRTGQIRKNRYGAPKLGNDKSKVSYDE